MPSRTHRKQAVFLDRDGVLNRTYERGGISCPPACLEEFELLPGAMDATQSLAEAGFSLVVVSNQPDVARGSQTRERVEQMNDIIRVTLPVREVLTCFHDNADGCPCRKPNPGLLLEAACRWDLDLTDSFMVGDRWSDVVAGQAAGCRSVLILTGHSGSDRCRPEHIVAGLPEAAAWILSVPARGVA
jgi:D-glycero-D-manno-heptose 1,7-bisphosphate phosphatase